MTRFVYMLTESAQLTSRVLCPRESMNDESTQCHNCRGHPQPPQTPRYGVMAVEHASPSTVGGDRLECCHVVVIYVNYFRVVTFG